jgi:DNA-binding MarR family transcriptional regulator
LKEKYSNILVEFFEKMSSWENAIVADRDISLSQMHLLEVVGNNNPIRMKELSEKLGVTTGTLTVMVHRLEKKSYIEKVKDKDDKRSYFIQLTEFGEKEYEHHHLMHAHLIDDVVSIIGETNCISFFKHLEEIQEIM